MSGNDERKNERKMSEAKRRQTQLVFCRALRARPRLPTGRRTSIGVPPRFSPQGVFHRKGLSLRPGFLGRGGTRFAYPLSGRYTDERQTAEELGVGVRTLRKWRQLRIGPPYIEVGRQIHYGDESRAAWLKS